MKVNFLSRLIYLIQDLISQEPTRIFYLLHKQGDGKVTFFYLKEFLILLKYSVHLSPFTTRNRSCSIQFFYLFVKVLLRECRLVSFILLMTIFVC